MMFEIMLALMFASLGALILGSILTIYGRYGLRRQKRRLRAILYPPSTIGNLPTEGDLSEPPHRVGLGPSVIALLRRFVYNASHRLTDGEARECSVCLSPILKEATVRLLPNCKHIFHADCIDMWLNLKTNCPICCAMAEPS